MQAISINKSPGEDDISIELIQETGDEGVNMMVALMQ